MKPPCEVIVLEILPAARSYVANKLIDKGLAQVRVAQLMGLTQPAVSQYRRKMRGYNADIFEKNKVLKEMMDELVDKIAHGLSIEEQSLAFRDICRTVLKKGLACSLHRKHDHVLGDCNICLTGDFCSK